MRQGEGEGETPRRDAAAAHLFFEGGSQNKTENTVQRMIIDANIKRTLGAKREREGGIETERACAYGQTTSAKSV